MLTLRKRQIHDIDLCLFDNSRDSLSESFSRNRMNAGRVDAESVCFVRCYLCKFSASNPKFESSLKSWFKEVRRLE